MSSDGDLSRLIQRNLPQADWLRIESGGTGRGIPDLNGCCSGIEAWIECKATEHWAVEVWPEQVAWAERRARFGGRVFLAVRQKRTNLWLLNHEGARALREKLHRLDQLPAGIVLYRGEGGPGRWSWATLARIFFPKGDQNGTGSPAHPP